MSQKGFVNIIFVLVIIVIAAIGGYFSSSRKPWLITQQDRIWIEIDPIQCLENPWERDWIQTHNNDYSSYPRNIHTPESNLEEIQIIKNYYNNNYQVAIHDVRSVTFDKISGKPLAVCEACSCPQGYTLYLLVSNSDVKKMLNLKYKVSDYTP